MDRRPVPTGDILVSTLGRQSYPNRRTLPKGPGLFLPFALGRHAACAGFSPDGLTRAVGGTNKQFAVFDVDV